MSKALSSAIVGLLLILPVDAARAQCVNTAQPTCGFYDRCLEKHCSCGWSSSGYALSYGLKYCKRFLAAKDLSPAGKRWRDATLVCLQEKLVPLVPQNPSQKCDCGAVRTAAYDSHVACYTQPGASICSLSVADLKVIDQTVDASDQFDRDGLTALASVLKACIASDPSFPAKALIAKISNLLH